MKISLFFLLALLLILPASASAQLSSDGRLIADNLLALNEVTADQVNPTQTAHARQLDQAFYKCGQKYFTNNKRLQKRMKKDTRFARSVLSAYAFALVHNNYAYVYIWLEDFFRGEVGQLNALPLTNPVYIAARNAAAERLSLLLDSYTPTPLDASPGCAVLKMIARSKEKVISYAKARRIYFEKMNWSSQDLKRMKGILTETIVPIKKGYDQLVAEGATDQESFLYQLFFYDGAILLPSESNKRGLLINHSLLIKSLER